MGYLENKSTNNTYEYFIIDNYVGRFAPSPSGALHFGSLVCALASFIDAKAHHGLWLLRIEDIDPPRTQLGASENIITTLSHFGLVSDKPVIFQSERTSIYQYWIDYWLKNDQAYYCYCTRQQIKSAGSYYTGVCRSQKRLLNETNRTRQVQKKEASVRLNVDLIRSHWTPQQKEKSRSFTDLLQGLVYIDQSVALEDFIIKRKDQFFAYNLAVTIDDIAQEVDHIVRGSDLLELTGRQLTLYQLFDKTPPNYLHLPLVLDRHHHKLSKQNHAKELSLDPAMRYYYLYHALIFLGQHPENHVTIAHIEAESASCSHLDLLHWAIAHWDRDKIPKKSYYYEVDHCYNKLVQKKY